MVIGWGRLSYFIWSRRRRRHESPGSLHVRRGHPRITRSAGCLTRHSPPSCSRLRAARPACCYPFPSGFVLERSIHPWLACSRKHAYAIDRCEIERLTRPLSCMSALVTNCRGGQRSESSIGTKATPPACHSQHPGTRIKASCVCHVTRGIALPYRVLKARARASHQFIWLLLNRAELAKKEKKTTAVNKMAV